MGMGDNLLFNPRMGFLVQRIVNIHNERRSLRM